MGKLNIQGGTPTGSTTLCKTCTYAHVITGFRESEMVMICTDVHPNLKLPFPVYECTAYYDKNRPSWKQMQDLAVDVTPGPLKNVGFKLGIGFAETAVKIPLTQDDADEDGD